MITSGDTGKDIFLCSISVRLHVCCIFQNLINAIRRFNAFKKKGQRFLPRIYINRENILPRAKEGTGEITANIKRLRKVFGACGGGVLAVADTYS